MQENREYETNILQKALYIVVRGVDIKCKNVKKKITS